MLRDVSDQRSCTHIADIPEHVLTKILTFLKARERLQLETVSKSFRRASADNWTKVNIIADTVLQHQAQLKWLGGVRKRNAHLVSDMSILTRGTCIDFDLPISGGLPSCSAVLCSSNSYPSSLGLKIIAVCVMYGMPESEGKSANGSDLLYNLRFLQANDP